MTANPKPIGNPYRYKASGRFRNKPSKGQKRDSKGRFIKSKGNRHGMQSR